MGNGSHMDRVWPWITNPDMLSISHAWAGHPGTLVKAYPSAGLPIRMATLGPSCSASGFAGWALKNGSLIAPPAAAAAAGGSGSAVEGEQQCMVGLQHSGIVNEDAFSCPPATTASKVAPQCGNMLFNCSAVGGFWTLKSSGELAWAPQAGDLESEKCLAITPGIVATDRNGSKASDPAAAAMKFGSCVAAGKTAAPAASFTLAGGALKVGTGECLGAGDAPGLQLWAKPMAAAGGSYKLAFLVLNPLSIPQTLSLPLADLLGNPCMAPAAAPAAAAAEEEEKEEEKADGGQPAACTLRDVWAAKGEPLSSPMLHVSLLPHESKVWILSSVSEWESFKIQS